MKKLFALLLALAMVASLFAGCAGDPAGTDPSGSTPSGSTPPDSKPTDPDPTVPNAEALPADPLYHWDFETTEGLTAMAQTKDDAGAVTGISEISYEILTADGVVGKSLYLDGKYGVKLDLSTMDIADDSYTISFWIYAERLGDFMPIVQLGRNMAGDVALESAKTKEGAVAWLNFTRGSWAETYPLAWNRNSSIPWGTDENGVFPWIAGPADEVYGKGEWCLVTLVVDGNRYTCADDAGERIGTRYYLNGQLVFDASAEYLYYQGVAPELFTGSAVEGYIGINYWDSLYKGYIDELIIYDEPLTSGQVVTLYEQGDTAVVPEAPVAGGGVEDEPVITLPEITPDASAIDTLGTTDRSMGFWTDWTESYELADGASLTVRLNNYSNASNNWSNFVGVLTNMKTAAGIAPAEQSADYLEYAAFRADAYGWDGNSEVGTYVGTFTPSWTDWAAWLELMKDAEVTVVVTRADGQITVEITFVGADGTTMTETGTVLSDLPADAPCFFMLTGENAYIEILEVK